ncbi:chemotaxis protein CheB [Methylobacterium oxalidis]|uniref:protein-glutamate methylesterase n=1 Tax=Methylobacterium oxalidis TaxID=944322 RepID=A0A512J1K1_9HYPH|nr:chemotaxis protein CheB [Methylobacterium oxalidis]GEP03841.1 protein-glutamate methylesterase [Methylobacterium oxalidis]GJE31285.1 Protein-glutamate methylesterase/protein-glutamine glutaminase [Methylobacterium oxalidis]GLS65301.1 protein-glutamate methylesterase [Methylobacterium oxalidis]
MTAELRIVVVGASAGGVPALQEFVAGLPAGLDAAVFIVLHLDPYARSHLDRILNRCSPLPVGQSRDGQKIRAGQIYVSSPDLHLLVERERVGVKHGPKENRFRPSIDALFRSAAYTHRERVIGIVLSGLLNDGTSGLWSIKQLGGTTIVQDPREATFDDMPRNALEQVEIDHILPVREIGPLVGRLVKQSPGKAREPSEDLVERMEAEVAVAASENAFQRGIMRYGELTALTCPECHGALVKITEGPHTRFRCHTGHGFTADALLSGITETAEEALWNAQRALEEGVMLLDDMAAQLEVAGKVDEAAQLSRSAREMEQRASALQEQVTQKIVGADTLQDQSEEL